jgi:hypothetical protein
MYYQHRVLGHGGHARPEETKRRIETLDAFWKDDTLADIDGQKCREYVRSRVGKPWKSAKPEQTGRPPRLVTNAAAAVSWRTCAPRSIIKSKKATAARW